MTKIEKFNAIIEMVGAEATFEDGATVAEFLNHEVEMMQKRASHKSKVTSAKKAANDGMRNDIVAYLESKGEGATATEIAEHLAVSTQKIAAVVRPLISDGVVTRVKSGKVMVYTLAE